MMLLWYKVQLTNRPVEEEVLPDSRTMPEAGASPRTIGYAIIAKSMGISKLIDKPSRKRIKRLKDRSKKGNRQEEVKLVGSSTEILTEELKHFIH